MRKIMPLLVLPLWILFLSGCSELRVIGKATVRELTSEAINVERASYRPIEVSPEPQKTKVAKANLPATAKKEKKKGLWEHL